MPFTICYRPSEIFGERWFCQYNFESLEDADEYSKEIMRKYPGSQTRVYEFGSLTPKIIQKGHVIIDLCPKVYDE